MTREYLTHKNGQQIENRAVCDYEVCQKSLNDFLDGKVFEKRQSAPAGYVSYEVSDCNENPTRLSFQIKVF